MSIIINLNYHHQRYLQSKIIGSEISRMRISPTENTVRAVNISVLTSKKNIFINSLETTKTAPIIRAVANSLLNCTRWINHGNHLQLPQHQCLQPANQQGEWFLSFSSHSLQESQGQGRKRNPKVPFALHLCSCSSYCSCSRNTNICSICNH